MYLLLMHVRILKKKTTSCCKHVPVRTYLLHLPGTLVYLLVYVRTYCAYCCFYSCTYVPTVRTALTNAISTHLLRKTAAPTVRTYCCTYS